MEPISTGASAISSLRSLYEIAKEIRNSNDVERLRTAAAQMFDLSMAAREQTALLDEQYFALRQELAALKAEVEKASKFEADKEKYVRTQANSGAFVFREKVPLAGERQPPDFCAHCFENQKLSILQPTENHRMDKCWGCGAVVRI